MAKVSTYDITGKSTGELTLNDAVFGIEPHTQAVFDAVTMQRASMRQGTHATKTRAAVRGGGRKPWKQKGTGRARQGSIRAPHWKGGGIAFGPTPRDYSYRINKKVRKLALRSVLSQKVLDGEFKVLESMKFETPKQKTKEVVALMSVMEAKKPLFLVTEEDTFAVEAIRNIEGALVLHAEGFNVYDALCQYDVVATKAAVAKLEEVLG